MNDLRWCPGCGNEFEVARKDQRYCGGSCRWKVWAWQQVQRVAAMRTQTIRGVS